MATTALVNESADPLTAEQVEALLDAVPTPPAPSPDRCKAELARLITKYRGWLVRKYGDVPHADQMAVTMATAVLRGVWPELDHELDRAVPRKLLRSFQPPPCKWQAGRARASRRRRVRARSRARSPGREADEPHDPVARESGCSGVVRGDAT